MTESDDKRTVRCRRLGHEVSFHYCRTQEGHTVCPSILNCWWEIFDVRRALKKHLSPEQIENLTTRQPPKPKLASILELVEAAKRGRKR
jgi:hypothetical protein